ncbi:VanZ family protein [Clostridium sp. WILCCON 0269]|uniref:VanZ family protein n=1 Tax=Candidatus Clostridium eludens TaxID=3381663 RepID=A0ABW8SHE6_9CLOT
MKKILCIFLCLLWMGFIFYNSSENGTSSNKISNSILNSIINKYHKVKNVKKLIAQKNNISSNSLSGANNNKKINNSPNTNRMEKLNLILRKNAHAFEYIVLAIITTVLLFSFNVKGKSAVIYIMFICLFYAVTDEFHQMFVPGRSSLVSDVLIDFSGSIIGIAVSYLIYYKFYSKLITFIHKKAV